MKRKILVLIIVIIILLPGCSGMGVMGEDGDIYIAYSWVSITQVYTDDPSFGPTIYNDQYETATEGTWYFEYTSLGYSWYGTYTVYRNPGVVGYDGADIYFMLTLYSFGPSFYDWSYPYTNSRDLRGDEYSEIISRGGYTIELHAQRRIE